MLTHYQPIDLSQFVLLEDKVESGIVFQAELTIISQNYSIWIDPKADKIYLFLRIGSNFYLSWNNPK